MNPWLIAAAVGTVGSSLLAGKGQSDSGKAQQVAYDFNARVQERNALVAITEADTIGLLSEQTVQDIRGKYKEFQGRQERTLAMNGWDADTGTGLQLQLEGAYDAETDVANQRYNTAVTQAALLEQATQDRISADLQRLYGSQARREGQYRSGTTLLSGLTRGAQLIGMA